MLPVFREHFLFFDPECSTWNIQDSRRDKSVPRGTLDTPVFACYNQHKTDERMEDMSVIKTERLTLRPLRAEDAGAMYRNWTWDERVARYCRWYPHRSIEETKAYLQMCLDQYSDRYDYRWAITLNGGDDEPVGCIDVVWMDEKEKLAEVGYLLAHDHWNKGYLTEALRAVIEKLFAEGFETIEAEHHVDNPASGRVMEKCGMQYVRMSKEQAKYGSEELCNVKWYHIKKK